MQEKELVLRLAQLLYDRKALDIVVLNVTHLTVLCDHMIIASGRNPNQVSSLADAIDEISNATDAEAVKNLQTQAGAEMGEVKIGGLCWSARAEDGRTIPVGEHVTVLAVQGVKLIVK